jgi:hypothetical protein
MRYFQNSACTVSSVALHELTIAHNAALCTYTYSDALPNSQCNALIRIVDFCVSLEDLYGIAAPMNPNACVRRMSYLAILHVRARALTITLSCVPTTLHSSYLVNTNNTHILDLMPENRPAGSWVVASGQYCFGPRDNCRPGHLELLLVQNAYRPICTNRNVPPPPQKKKVRIVS